MLDSSPVARSSLRIDRKRQCRTCPVKQDRGPPSRSFTGSRCRGDKQHVRHGTFENSNLNPKQDAARPS